MVDDALRLVEGLIGMRPELTSSSGPIVRINPHEVHCNDAQFIDEIYAVGGRKRDKPFHQVSGSR